MLSLMPSGVLLPGLAGCWCWCWWWWCGWGEWEPGSEKLGLFSFSDGEMTSSESHCRRTSRDWNMRGDSGNVSHQDWASPSVSVHHLTTLSTHHYLSVGIIFAETIEDDVSWDADHAEHATLRAPADHLNSKRVFFHQLGGAALAWLWLLKHFGGLHLVQHLQRDCTETSQLKHSAKHEVNGHVHVVISQQLYAVCHVTSSYSSPFKFHALCTNVLSPLGEAFSPRTAAIGTAVQMH